MPIQTTHFKFVSDDGAVTREYIIEEVDTVVRGGADASMVPAGVHALTGTMSVKADGKEKPLGNAVVYTTEQALVAPAVLVSMAPPVIGALSVGNYVEWAAGSYNVPPDSIVSRLFKTPALGVEAEVSTPYTLAEIDNNASFRVIEYPAKSSQSPTPNQSARVTLVVQVIAEPLLSVSATANTAAGTVTFTMVPKPGQNPTKYLFGYVGGTKSESISSTVTVPHVLGTFTPEAQAVVGSVISAPITGPAFTLSAPLRVTGTLAFTTGAEATQGEVLAYSGLTISGASSVAHSWTDDGVTISGQNGATLNTAGKLGAIGLEITITGQDGTTATRTASLNVVAPPAFAPSAPQNLRVGTTSGDGVPFTADAPASAGSSAITGYELTYSLGGGAPVTLQSATRDFLITGLTDSRNIVATMAATNGTLSAASAPMTVYYIHGLSSGNAIQVQAGPGVSTFIQLNDHDRARGNISLIDNGTLPGATATLKDQSGVQVGATISVPILFSPTALTAQRGLVFEIGNGSLRALATAYYFSSPTDMGQISAPSLWVGGVITVDRQASFPQFKPELDEMRYRLRILDNASPTSPSVDQPFSSATTSTSISIPTDAIGKYLLVLWNSVDKLTGQPYYGSSLPTATSSGILGPISETATASTITQATADAGVSIPIGAIAGFNAAGGVRITVTAATDSGGTGGFWVAAHTSAGETIGLTTIGVSAVGSVYDMAPPTAVLPEDTDAIVVGPAGAGTFSYTLSFSALGSVAVAAGVVGLLGNGAIGLLGQGAIGLL